MFHQHATQRKKTNAKKEEIMGRSKGKNHMYLVYSRSHEKGPWNPKGSKRGNDGGRDTNGFSMLRRRKKRITNDQ